MASETGSTPLSVTLIHKSGSIDLAVLLVRHGLHMDDADEWLQQSPGNSLH